MSRLKYDGKNYYAIVKKISTRQAGLEPRTFGSLAPSADRSAIEAVEIGGGKTHIKIVYGTTNLIYHGIVLLITV